MRPILSIIILLLLVGCRDAKKKPAVVNVAGTYAMEVNSPYGITRDTIIVQEQSVQQNLYLVTHKVRFIKRLNGTDATYHDVTRTHVATYEEHLGHLQDINDGTLFMLYHENEDAIKNTAHYTRIN
ncbi:MAG: hypothetical protein EOP50_00340 [Sphingobacteriales bacterium]|nr:MAG: hypothetical protein EOP50_00340 [Sphingobacteriales bacterium]